MTDIFKTHAVIFDMDGILVDSEPLWISAEREAMIRHGIDRDDLFERLNFVSTGMRLSEVVELVCRALPDHKLDASAMTQEIIQGTIDKVRATKPILPGVVEALQLCRSLGLKVGLASSSVMVAIDAVTDCLGITDYFDVRVSAEHLAYGKPHPEVYLLAAKKLGEHPLNCITVEDSIAGMIATKAAKMRSIVVPAAADRDLPQWCLADYQLPSLLSLTKQHLL